jgi:hypothetical protein
VHRDRPGSRRQEHTVVALVAATESTP